ncbi:hypothetical protein [Paraburkholderia youngii]|uniref:hypothetical protein n=1 Tax=Paraburkholderia youngii TaxID=2782701 RepID=UPI003D1C23A1
MMNTTQSKQAREHQLPFALQDGRYVGLVEKVEFTHGGAGNQVTTISGVRYITFWDSRTKDWKEGDIVAFNAFKGVLWHNGPNVLQASNIAKFDLANAEDHRFGGLVVNRRQFDVMVAALRLLGKAMENAQNVASGADVGGATCVELNDGDVGSIMTCEGVHRGMTLEEVDAFCDELLNGPIVDWTVKVPPPKAGGSGARAAA